MPDILLSSLVNISNKIRRLTRNPSESQLSSIKIIAYVDDFILYDMPAHVKLDSLKTIFTFYTNPHQAEYETVLGITVTGDDFYHFKDYYTNVSAPIYISGNKALFTQSLQEFYGLYPRNEQRVQIGVGNGVKITWGGTLANAPILKKSLYATSVNYVDNRLLLKDNGEGGFDGNVGYISPIEYLTGGYAITFNEAPKNGAPVWMNYIPYTAGKPDTILFFNDKITVRPIPEYSYKVDLTVYRRPSEMLSIAPGGIIPQIMPELSEWWQYIAYGAAIKVLQDRLDFDTIELLMPEFKRQEVLINRRKIVQNSNKRAQTIFSTSIEKGS